MKKIKVLELYSGIGGLHYSLIQALINYIHNWNNENIRKDIKSIFHFISLDLNHLANQTHYHNFQENCIYLTSRKDIKKFFKKKFKSSESHEQKIQFYNSKKQKENKNNISDNNENEFNYNKNYIIQTDINNLTAQFFDFHQFDILLISNPCQPYTRQNKSFKKIDLNEIISKNNNIRLQFHKTKEETNKNSYEESNNNVYNEHSKNNNKDANGNYDVLDINKNEKNFIYCDKNMRNGNNMNECIYTSNYNDLNNNDSMKNQNYPNEIYDKFSTDNLDVEKIIGSLDFEKDERTNSFIHICNLLKNTNTQNLPQYIFIENVKNFEVSFSFLYFIHSIQKNYNFQTYHLSPLQFGIPNERLRFYCICKKKDNLNDNKEKIIFEKKENTLYSNSLIPQKYISFKSNENSKKNEKITFYMPSIITYLDINEKFSIDNMKFKNINMIDNNLNEFEVKKDILKKKSAYCFDIIDINKKGNKCCFDSNEYYAEKNNCINNFHNERMKYKINSKKVHSMCFTSNYGRYIIGSGSILYFCKYKKKKKKNNNNIITDKLYKQTLHEYNVKSKSENELINSSTSEELNNLSNENYSIEVSYKSEYEDNEMRKYENKVRYFTPTEICRLMGFKIHTEKYNLKKNVKNTYGNIFWNIDHINHKCAYNYNIHYCDANNTNTCLLNSIEYVKNTKKEIEEEKKCFCHEFKFPNFISNRQKLKLIGNSVNIVVISLILQTHNIFDDFNIKNLLH
ncbi:DNA (cytosine-5)-methyltransferase, putative [Plasmodium gallinaceum]|uniref:DNA (Cytosine-5)-methyltransferase, putative n=1 Tax=Plasmodium gallinaceum TaxID=5849 RepID=A0A1J1GLI5_PLAGA|nr:DNA (cytosine-5)-methyltransferase, putative [Plasmodium gallinaceum]CRG93270.1 DNA (cytosine-5)-methyltransferase, putative [Plasmodium gallinaceum]